MQVIRFFGTAAGCDTSAGAVPIFVMTLEGPHVTHPRAIRPGWRDVRDRARALEADPKRRQGLIDARKRMAPVLSVPGTLTFLRLERGLSRRNLAVLSAIPEAVLARLEAGTEDPRLSVCRRLAQALDRSLAEIVAVIAAGGPREREPDRPIDSGPAAASRADAAGAGVPPGKRP
ncbi:helix-turn-helix domain-containing protein [Aromatoleum evansii]|uniref:helix-turn-helix domain-containing protein n=1 Tax=Aromatoleum evansii TaxID=59406 RepID=UPI00145E423A|nr:helix-turn-helix transcriptional regulator [Aromatoleum evansii]NMG28079.1 helix-turn-helix domain-containing protein [Aromatoleum evansii]